MAKQYRPLYKLDSGGMAEVYVAEAISMAGFKKKVAIKRILPGLLKESRFVRMFLDEARLSLRLNHANIVSVFDIGKTDNTYFIVMEYVEGTTLKSLLSHFSEQNRRLPVALTIWIINEILKGLHYAHNLRDSETSEPLGIVHRDISPPNILMSWNSEIKLTDFGLAKATTQLESTDPGVVKGKFSYLSPESARGEEVDLRTDIFAVGILLFEMLTGQRLFLGESDWQTVEKVRAAQIPNIRAINPDIPEMLEGIVHRSLARDPKDRYACAADFAEDLIGVLFAHQMRVSSRDMTQILEEIRSSKPSKSAPQISPGGTNLIMQLMLDELAGFRSIDEISESEEHSSGSSALDFSDASDPPSQAYDPSVPLVENFPESRSTSPSSRATIGSSARNSGSVALRHSKFENYSVAQAEPSQAQQRNLAPVTSPTQANTDSVPYSSSSASLSVAANSPPSHPPMMRSPAPRKKRSILVLLGFLGVTLIGGGAAAYFYLGTEIPSLPSFGPLPNYD